MISVKYYVDKHYYNCLHYGHNLPYILIIITVNTKGGRAKLVWGGFFHVSFIATPYPNEKCDTFGPNGAKKWLHYYHNHKLTRNWFRFVHTGRFSITFHIQSCFLAGFRYPMSGCFGISLRRILYVRL